MNYSTWIILCALANLMVIFSGLPTSGKKLLIVVSSLILLMVGSIFRAVENRQKRRILEKKQAVNKVLEPEIEQVADEVAQETFEQVEHEIDELSSHRYETR